MTPSVDVKEVLEQAKKACSGGSVVNFDCYNDIPLADFDDMYTVVKVGEFTHYLKRVGTRKYVGVGIWRGIPHILDITTRDPMDECDKGHYKMSHWYFQSQSRLERIARCFRD